MTRATTRAMPPAAPRRRRMPGAAALAAALLLGCTAPGSEMGGGALDNLGTIIEAARADAPEPLEPVGAFPGVDPALIAGVTNPLIGVYLEDSGALATVGMPSRAGAVTTWMSGDSRTIAVLDPGIVIATRGLPVDLHAAEAGSVAHAVAQRRAASYTRDHRMLDSTYAPRILRLACELRAEADETLVINQKLRQTRRMAEACTAAPDGAVIENIYWVDVDSPIIWQSRQWLGPEVGAAFLQLLVP